MNTIRKISTSLLLVGLFILGGCANQTFDHGRASFLEGKYSNAFNELAPVAKNGNPEAQYAIGYMYYYGKGVRKNHQQAEYWIDQAADAHYPPALAARNMIHKHKIAVLTGEDKKTIHTRQSNVRKVAPNRSKLTQSRLLKNHQGSHQSKQYTVQILGAWRKSDLQKYAKKHALQGKVVYYRTVYRGKNWYVLAVGQFNNLHEAEMGIKQLPASVQKLHPWVRPLATLQPIVNKIVVGMAPSITDQK